MNILSIDWLQLGAGGALPKQGKFTIKKLDYATRHFKTVEEIYLGKKHLFTIAREPHSNILPKDHHLIKFDNKYLYNDSAIYEGFGFIRQLGLTVKNLSRLDLAIDFNTFNNNLKPTNFIQGFLTNKYIHNGRNKFKIIGQQDKKFNFEYFRFGNPISRCSVYLYNKTKELNEVKFKQYIFNKWKESGLDTTKDIWRLEASLKSGNFDILDKETGETIKFNISNLESSDYLEALFIATINKYFAFKHTSKLKNKSRWKDVKLFKNIAPGLDINFISGHEDFNRSDKIFLKKFESLNQELRGNDFELSTFSQAIINKFVKSRRLEKFYDKKVLMN